MEFGMNGKSDKIVIPLSIVKPYNLELSMRAVRSFQPTLSNPNDPIIIAARVDGIPTLIKVDANQEQTDALVATSTAVTKFSEVRRIAEWVLFADLDLKPFYHLTSNNSRLSIIIKKLYGLKPMRPASLFEMVIIAITEQQISLAAAYKIRSRIIEQFGDSLNDYWVFPEPKRLANASIESLRSCGLSKQKADYIHNISEKIVYDGLDLDSLKSIDDAKVRETIVSWRGFGRWSADYILVRGLARPDCVPIDDLAIRSAVGEYLGNGERVTAEQAEEILEQFRPYRGLVAFYLLAHHKLNLMAAK
jgi:DNA-3-methyladenine glycosylase II